MNRQAAKEFEKADAELNKTYAALMAKLLFRFVVISCSFHYRLLQV